MFRRNSSWPHTVISYLDFPSDRAELARMVPCCRQKVAGWLAAGRGGTAGAMLGGTSVVAALGGEELSGASMCHAAGW